MNYGLQTLPTFVQNASGRFAATFRGKHMQTWHYWALAAAFLPLLAGSAVALSKGAWSQGALVRAQAWTRATYSSLAASPSLWRRHGVRWLLWPWMRMEHWVAALAEPAWKAGALTAGYGYGLVLALTALAALLYAALIVLVIFLALAISLWVLGMVLGGNSGGNDDGPMREVRTSRERKNWMGETYVEHLDGDGQVVARSTEETTWLGDKHE